jgi:regulator of sigma E protease
MTITAIITFFVILFVLVIVHELGHFIFAKLTGIQVDEFAFGFPPRLFSKKIGETLYSFNLIPLGGYVKIFGENGDSPHLTSPNLGEEQNNNSFASKSPLARIIVLIAGVLFNIIAAIFLFTFSFLGSDFKNISHEEALTIPFNERKILIRNIDEKSSFNNNQFFKVGSEILSISTKKDKIPTSELTGKNIGEFVQANNNSVIKIEYKTIVEGENIIKTIDAVPQAGIVEGKKILGLGFADVADRKYSLFESLKAATIFTFDTLQNIFVELWTLLKNLFSGNSKVQDSLSGPVGLAILTGKVSTQGISNILFFSGMLSLSLAAFNILPIPALDGGRIIFVLLEVIFNRKIPVKIEQSFHGIGFILLISLMIFVTYFDMLKII